MNKDNKNNNVFTDQKFKEVVSKRGACMKVFENEDHSMTAAIYGRPVHYMKEGRWEEIDSRFTAGAQEEGDVEGDCGSMKLCLSNKAKEKGMVRIGQGEKRLTWGLVGCSAVKRELDQTGQDSCAAADAAHGSTGTEGIRPEAGQDRGAVVREAMSVKMPAGKAVYPEILPGTDLVYLTGPGILKENIIFKTAEAAGDLAGKVTWRYDTGRLMPEQAADGQVLFKDAAGAVIYQLAAPHMTDASGQKSTALRLSLEAGDRKAAVITLTADMEWLSDSQRVYPVTVDPEVSTPVDRASIEDCHVSSYYNTDNFYNSHILKTGCTDGSILRSYLKFTLPDIVKAADMVVGACLYLTKGSSGSGKRYIDVHRVKSSWNSRTLTWDNKPAYDANILDYASFATSGAALLTFDITGVVKDWYLEGKSSNNGLLIKEHGEEEGTYSEYVSSDDVTPDDAVLRPHIMIRYVNYSGLEDFWTYHDHGAGRAGTGYVNDYNGNQIFIHDTLTMSGSRAPIALKHIFNSNDRASDIGCGRGWRLNYHQTIVGEEIGTVQYYKHVDGDGTAHYFAEDSSSQWKDENNKELILTMDSSSTDAYYTITDKADHKRIFNSAGLLVKVQDANGNAAVITYSGSKIIRLTDGSGRAVALSYGTDGKLAKVTDPAGRAKTFAYSGGYLTAITDTDSAVSRFTYDTASGRGMMLSAEDPYGYRIQYSYHSQPPYRVTKIAEYAGTTAGQSISLSYGHNRTLFEDSKKRQEVYLFDDAGRTVSIRSHTGYGASWQYLDTERNANKLSAASGLQYVSPQYLKGVIGGMSGWSRYTTEDTITVADDGGTAYIGQRSIRISSTALTGHACAYQDLALVPGKKYVFSAYMKAGIKERAANGCIWLQVTNKDKNLAIVANSRLVTANTGFEDFKRLQVAFTAPASDSGVANLRILARMRYIIGDCWYDGLQLEEGEAAGRLNLVVNNCFSKGLDGYTKLLFATGDGILHTGEAAQVEKELTAIVNEDKVNLRKAAGTAYTALVQVPKNTAAYIAGADYDSDGAIWYAIRVTVSGRQYIGYMKGTYLNLSISGAHVTAAGVIAGGPLNIRSGPGTGYSSIALLDLDTKVGIKGAAKDSGGTRWYKLSFKKDGAEKEGYASADYVALQLPGKSYGRPAGTLNVRTEPNTDCSVKVQIGTADTVTISTHAALKNGDIWYGIRVTKNGTAYTGYVLSDLVNVTKTDTPPVIRMGQQETVPGGNGPTGDSVLKITGDEKTDKRVYQKIYVSGKKGDCFVANGWGYAHGVCLEDLGNDNRKKRHFGIHINFVSADNKHDIHYADFGADCSEWQFLHAPFIAGQDYVRVDIGFTYGRNANHAYFTGLALYKEQFGTSFTYDDKGNLVTVTDQAKTKSSFEYDSSDNLKKLLDAKGNAFTYTYDSRHNPLTAKSAANLNYAFAYDAYGNPLTARVVDPDTPADAKTAMTTKAVYTTGVSAGQYMAKQTDAAGNSTLYDWDGTKGLLDQVTDAAQDTTGYTYDGMDRLTAVTGKADVWGTAGDIRVQYAYEKDRLTKITHNGFDYVFTYNGFGRRTGVSIAGTAAISHSYGAGNGLLAKSTYGNGWEISYTYDELDRMKRVTAEKDGNSYAICSYIYDNQGRLARMADGQAKGKSCTYSYDLTGRLCEAVFDDGTAFQYIYDVNDCLTEERITTADGMRTIKRTYDADSRETGFTCGTAKVDVVYDKLGRLSSIKRNGKHTTTYTYKTAPDGGQTGQIAKVANGSEAISYTYDARGYVTSAVKGGETHRYQYDAQGQLIREEDPVQGKTFAYFYDIGGNLVKIRSYDLTTAADLEPLPHVSRYFTYGNTWRDQLTAADGQAYAYDAIGNLLNDGKYSYTWKNGRQLAGITGEGLTAAYTYDADGIRTSKTVNGVKTEYLTAGGKVLSEKKGSTWQHYLYDGSGNLSAIRYKGADYYYVRDGLMNITGLVDSNGNTVVSYSYDSWGRMLGVSGSMASTLGQENPYRYKEYYYDAETGFYYLESRYYHPEICRFINADIFVSTEVGLGGSNMYCYCGNNPVNEADPFGTFALVAAVGGFLAKCGVKMAKGAVVNVITSLLAAKVTGQEYTIKDGVVAAVTGAIGAIPGYSWVAGLIAGGYTGWMSYTNGAGIVGALTVGVISGLATASSYSSMVEKYGKQLEDGYEVLVDTIFTATFNTVSAAAYQSFTPPKEKNVPEPVKVYNANVGTGNKTKPYVNTSAAKYSNRPIALIM